MNVALKTYKQLLKERVTHAPADREGRGQTESRLRKKGWETFPVAVAFRPGGVWRRLGRVEVQARPDRSAVGVARSAFNWSSALHWEEEGRAELSEICWKTSASGGWFIFICAEVVWFCSVSKDGGALCALCCSVRVFLHMLRPYKWTDIEIITSFTIHHCFSTLCGLPYSPDIYVNSSPMR